MVPPYPLLQEGDGHHGAVLREPEGAEGALVLCLAEGLHARVDDLDGLAILVGLDDVAHELKKDACHYVVGNIPVHIFKKS